MIRHAGRLTGAALLVALCAWPGAALSEIEHTGALRLIGTGSGRVNIHNAPEELTAPSWTGALVGRYIAASKGHPWQWQVNVFADVARVGQQGIGAFGTVGARGSSYRLPWLQQRLNMELLPILRAGGFALVNIGDKSGIAGMSVSWSASDEAEVMLGLFKPWGDRAELFDSGYLWLHSEMGSAPATVYLEARAFF